MKNREILKSPVTQLAVMTGAALVHTAWKDHRAKTHRSVELSPAVDAGLDIAGGPFTDTTRWAATHRVHHHTPDTNLLPAIEYTDLMQWFMDNPDRQAGYDMPDTLAGIDPAMPTMRAEDVYEVGVLAKQLVEGKYAPAEDYTPEDIERILYGTDPRYYYERPTGDMKAVPTVGENPSLHDIRYLLRDPHSPALHPDGLRGIAVYNMPLYQDVVKFFENNPQYMPDDLEFTPREAWIEAHKREVRLGFVAANMAARVVAEQPRTAGEVAKSAARGAIISGLGTLGLIAGGNIVNSLGHGGGVKIGSRQFWRDVRDGTVRPKENGTYTTNNRLLSPPTLGEVGGQFEHHEDPSLIAYTHDTGVKKWATDPFGSVTEFLATRGIGMQVGPGFEGRRPDLPSDAVLKVEELRRQYLASS